MGVINDLRGRTFGRLSIPATAEPVIHGRAYWPCLCECGKKKLVSGKLLANGRAVSCGCFRADPNVRQGARMKVPAKRRRAIALAGAKASVEARRK